MTAKQITLKNINEIVNTGRSIKGKGLQIFSYPKLLISETRWDDELLNQYEKILERLSKALKEVDLSEIYVSECRFNNEYFNSENLDNPEQISLSKFNVKQIIESNYKGFSKITFRYKSNFLGYIKVSSYDSSLPSQQQLVKDLLELQGYSIYGDFDDYEEADSKDCRYSRNSDYTLMHGDDNYYFEDVAECEYVDGRISNYNEQVLDDFWSFYSDELSNLADVDPEQTIFISHRKGKDFYIGYCLEEEEYEINYKDDRYEYEKNQWESECFSLLTSKKNEKLLERVKEIVQSWKDDCETKGFINNELEMGNTYSDYYNNSIVEQNLINLIYGEDNKDSLRDYIIDTIDNWSVDTISDEFMKAYNLAINEHVKVYPDLRVEVTTEPEYYSSEKPIKKIYNHLKILKILGKRFDYELVYSAISSNIDVSSYAIKKNNEEYHFDISKVIAEDINGANSLKDFIRDALSKLELRRVEKLSQKELFENATKVFVGFEDSIKSGNCEFGTKQFISKHKIDTSKIGGIRGDMLLELELSNFTKRAVMQALSSHGRAA